MESIIKLVDYFNCSIEYLCGNTLTVLEFEPKPCPPFGDWMQMVLKHCGKTSYQLFKETSIKSSQYYYWRKGAMPLLTSLDVIASYLDITLDYLVGRDR